MYRIKLWGQYNMKKQTNFFKVVVVIGIVGCRYAVFRNRCSPKTSHRGAEARKKKINHEQTRTGIRYRCGSLLRLWRGDEKKYLALKLF